MERLVDARCLVLTLLVLSACSTTQPRGQVVRLQKEITDEPTADTIPAQPVGPLYVLSKPGEGNHLDIPSAPEDAAVFHFGLGQAYSLDNDPQRAIESFRATLVHDPKSALVRARLAAELVKVGNFAEAKTLCEEAIAFDPKYIDSYLLLAGIQVAAKEFERAVSTYQQALKVEPKNRDALLYLGVTLAEVGKAQQGLLQLEKLVKLKDNPESNIDQSVGYFYLAKVYDQVNQKEKAIQAYKMALKRRPGFSKAAIAMSEIYMERHEAQKAYSVLEEAFLEGRSSDLAERLAERHLEQNDFQGAVAYLEALVEEDPTNENMKLRLALVYWQIKWLDKSRRLLGDLHERYPASSEITYYLGELELERGDLESALQYYSKVSSDYSKFDQMVSRVVFVYRQQGKGKQAETFLTDAMRKRPDVVAFYPLLAALYEDQQRLEESRVALEKGEKLFPSDENILYYLGFTYDKLGRKDGAMAKMERLLQVNPENANALNFVGYTLLERGKDLPQAKVYLERALRIKPNDAFVLDSYGWLLYRLGNNKEAMKQLEKAYSAKPDEGIIAEHLADVYVAMQLPRKAMLVYQQALKSGGDQEFLARVQTKMANVQEVLASGSKPAPVLDSEISVRQPASR